MTDRTLRTADDLDALDWAKMDGILPVVAQDARTGVVLMVAFASREALERSLASGRMHYWSRSRGELWRKGDTTGAAQHVESLHADCDGDTVLARVRQEGAACHTGEATCFGEVPGNAPEADSTAGASVPAEAHPDAVLAALDATLAERAATRPTGSYTVRLLSDENLRLKKLGEETAELVTALAKGDRARIPEEAADVIYHVLAALRAEGIGLEKLTRVLSNRAG